VSGELGRDCLVWDGDGERNGRGIGESRQKESII
jgi:hypothetical protein